MRVVIATGIFPPDIGGPATHSADLAVELRGRGHDVTVLTLTDEPGAAVDHDLVRFPRRWPWPVRTLAAVRWLVRNRDSYDVVYATGLDLAAVGGARLVRRPVVLKQVGDSAWERGRRQGLTTSGFDDFQHEIGGPLRLRAMRAARNWSVRRASAVVVPSASLGVAVERWTEGRQPVSVIANGVRVDTANGVRVDTGTASAGTASAGTASAGTASALPTAASPDGRLRVVFVGRLVSHKRLEVLLEALALCASATLDVVGDGPEEAALVARTRSLGLETRVRFLGALPHDEVMRHLAASDALVSATGYEGLPHVMIEAVVCGTPVISAATGGVSDVVADGVNGLLVDPPVAAGFAAAFDRLTTDGGLRARLREGATRSAPAWTFDRCADQVEDLLDAVRRPRPAAVYVGKGTASWPPGDDLRRKLAIHARSFRQLSIGVGPAGLRRVSGVRVVLLPRLGPAFYAIAPALAVGAAAAASTATANRRPGIVVCQSPFEGLGAILASRLLPPRVRPRIQVELHGDWTTASRLYGSRRRRLLGPAADAAACWALRRADRVRVVSLVLEKRARDAGFRGPIDRHVTYSEFDVFLRRSPVPLPEQPTAAFVGVLERYKAVDVLLDAWPAVTAQVPGAQLVMVGAGSLHAEVQERVRRDDITSIRLIDPMPQAELAELLDGATCLVLPSRSEGLARIVLEAMARGRAVVASAVGGIDELVDRSCGRVVPAEDVLALADALAEVLADPGLAASMGAEARRRAELRQPVAEYEAGVARLAAWASAPAMRTGQ